MKFSRSWLIGLVAATIMYTLPFAYSSSSAAAIAAPRPFGFTGQVITSPDGVSYLFYSGKTPSFDGLPIAADVTIPAGATGPLPLVAMFHGYGQDRTWFESTTVLVSGTGEQVAHSDWNNVAFAKRGYAVLNITDRGFHDSCGPAVPAATFASACASRRYWIHLADPRWDIHDAQYLIGKLVDEGVVNPQRIGVTGQSYGGGYSWLLAELNDRTMTMDGALVRWVSPKGKPLHIAVAVPQYTWASLTNSLLPNGRAVDSTVGSASLFENPVGVPLQSYTAGLFANGSPATDNGFYSPPHVDPTADLTTWTARLAAGAPFYYDATRDPVIYQAIQQLDRRSPLYIAPDARVPVFQEQGLTDPLFPPVQALMMRNHVQTVLPGYPIKSFFADIGHSYADNPADVWVVANAQAHAFIDYYLKGSGAAPAFDVTAMSTDCVAGQRRLTFRAPSWAALHTSTLVLASSAPQVTTNLAAGPEGVATDPIANGGCRTVALPAGSGAAAWSFPVGAAYILAGQPTVGVDFLSTGADVELNVRLWDVTPDGASETLVSRGTYRYLGAAGNAAHLSFQVSANVWQFQAGHTLRLEVVGNDAPYFQQDNVPSATTITGIRLSLPIRH